jgi:hypothetical protein
MRTPTTVMCRVSNYILVGMLFGGLALGQYRTCTVPCVHRVHPYDVIPCQHPCYGPYGAVPCHPAGDVIPCQHPVHPYDYVPC